MSFRNALLASVLAALVGATGCGDTCDDARDRIEECGSAANPGNENEECSGVIECAADCINDASCEAITGEAEGEANDLAGCLNRCSPEG